MAAYGEIALRIAQRVRQTDPAISKAAIARAIRGAWDQQTSRPAVGNLPASDRQIEQFLTKNGF